MLAVDRKPPIQNLLAGSLLLVVVVVVVVVGELLLMQKVELDAVLLLLHPVMLPTPLLPGASIMGCRIRRLALINQLFTLNWQHLYM